MGELAVLDGGGAPARGTVNLIEVAKQAEAAKNLGATLIKSGLLPQSITKPEQAMAILLTARELGLQPMFALKNITVIQGTPAPSEQALGVLIRRAGHKMRVVESTNELCTVEGVRADDPAHPQRVTFTVEDARRANLLGKSSWKNYTRAMLRARAKTELGRSMFEDALAGLAYSAEELGAEVDGEGEVLSAPEPRRNEAGAVDRGEARQRAEEPAEEAEVVDDGEKHSEVLVEVEELLKTVSDATVPNKEQVRAYARESYDKARATRQRLRRKLEEQDGRDEEGEPEASEEEPGQREEEPVPDFGDMRGAALENATPPQKARKSQTDLIRTLAEEFHGEEGVGHIERRIGKALSELTRAEADDLIDELSPEEGR